MRGKVLLYADGLSQLRITPAYAGKSQGLADIYEVLGDHPRVCGEKGFSQSRAERALGSPPRMRGKGCAPPPCGARPRITPAYAGKRARENGEFEGWKDHPRVCGEKSGKEPRGCAARGSPPRMRGKAAPSGQGERPFGITPAYAGKRLKRSRSTVSPVAIVPLFPSVCNKPVVSDGSPAGRDAPLFLPAENAVPASPAYNLRSL